MKKLIFMGVLGLFILGSCNNKAGHNHEGHNHGTEAHDHEHEGHDHEQKSTTQKKNAKTMTMVKRQVPDIATKSSCPKQKRMQPV